MGCLKCSCKKKLQTYCGVSCLIGWCIVGLGWATFLVIFSVTYKMTLLWKILTFFWGVLVFFVSLIFLVVTLHELFKRPNCWCQKYCMSGNSGDLSVNEQQEPSNRSWNSFISKRNKSSTCTQAQVDYATQENYHGSTQSSVQLNSENNSENRMQQCCSPKSQMDHIQENIPLESHSNFLRMDAKTGRANCRAAAMCSTPKQYANIKSESSRSALHKGVQARGASATVNSSSPRKKHFKADGNLQEASEISFDMQNSVNMILMGDVISSSESDIEAHIYENINSSYETEYEEEPDYEYVESLPPRPPPKSLNIVLATTGIPSGTCVSTKVPAGDVEIMPENILDAQIRTYKSDSDESGAEKDSRRFSINSDYESIKE